ncbi:GIY-YIG nuclease family protein [Stenoxybacter acetivorans]|uniref:GIY-YIG nuclease family protein n=1 Tax=Stenoxybacter acetivorans TaxID=422441 RepID=UPI00068E3F16|nr:GIY-YIG nuclease family protein [Stenoxybacter acetivorans]
MPTAKTIQLLLEDGDLSGLMTIEDSAWDGIMFVSPRVRVETLLSQEETKHYGVYFLLSEEQVYIGQASELSKRIKQHNAENGKEWWGKCCLLTTKDDSFNRSAIDYIEYQLIEKAKSVTTLHIDNKKSGNPPKVSRFEKTKYENYIDNTLLLLDLIGIEVFKSKKAKSKTSAKPSKSPSITHEPSEEYKNTVFYIKSKKTGADASAVFHPNDNSMTLQKGSRIADETKADFCYHQYDFEFENRILMRDLHISSPSMAVRIISQTRNGSNGWQTWKDENGKTLDERYRKDNAK